MEDAKDAKMTCKNIEIEGRRIRVEYSYTGQEREGGGGGSRGFVYITCSTFYYCLLLTTSSALTLTACFPFSHF